MYTDVWLVQYKIALWFSLHACAVDMQDEEIDVAMCILRPALSFEIYPKVRSGLINIILKYLKVYIGHSFSNSQKIESFVPTSGHNIWSKVL